MTFIVSLVSTLKSLGLEAFTVQGWLSAWGLSWLIAFPTLLLVMPLVKKLTSYLGRVDVCCLDFVRTGGALIAKRGAQFSYSK